MISRYVWFAHLWWMTASWNTTLSTQNSIFWHCCLTLNVKDICFSYSLMRNLWPWTRSLPLRTWCHWKRGEPAFRTNPTTLWTSGASWRTVSAKSYLRSRCLWVFLAATITKLTLVFLAGVSSLTVCVSNGILLLCHCVIVVSVLSLNCDICNFIQVYQ